MSRAYLGVALLALHASAWCVNAAPPRALFPNNLHLTRQVQDPLSGTAVTIEEYCSGNRMVAVSGDRTVVVDYDKQEITEIDRRAGTYSVSRFSDIAGLAAESGAASPRRQSAAATTNGAAPRERWKVTPQGVRGAAGRSVEQFEFLDEGEIRRKVDVGVDRSVALTREAVEVLIGAAYPNTPRDEHEPVLRAAAARSESRVATTGSGASASAAATIDDQPTYGLPVTQAFTFSDSGSELTFRSTITRVGAEAVPAEALLIPPGAKRVESPASAVRRQLRELDHPGSTSVPREN
jgi:hypothetical protein